MSTTTEMIEHFSRLVLGRMAIVVGIATVPAIATAPMPPELGLSKLNGKLSVESRPAGGTVIRLIFPQHKPE